MDTQNMYTQRWSHWGGKGQGCLIDTEIKQSSVEISAGLRAYPNYALK